MAKRWAPLLTCLTVLSCDYFESPERLQEEQRIAKKLLVQDTVLQTSNEQLAEAGRVSFTDQAQALEGFKSHVFPIVEAHCSSCHGAAVSPRFATKDAVEAFSGLMAANVISFNDPQNSRIVKRLSEQSHNCWSECPADAESLAQAIQNWSETVEVVAGNLDPTLVYITAEVELQSVVSPKAEEITPAEGEEEEMNATLIEAETALIGSGFDFTEENNPSGGIAVQTTESGPISLPESMDTAETTAKLGAIEFEYTSEENRNFRVYGRVLGTGQESDSFYVQVDDGDLQIWDIENSGESFEWVRLTSRQNRDNSRPFDPRLNRGSHTIRFFQRGAGVSLDAILITRNGNLDPETYKTDTTSTRVVYDLSQIKPELGPGVRFSVTVAELNEKSYQLSSPALTTGGQPIRIANIKPLINGIYKDQNATFTAIDETVSVKSRILMQAPLVVLKEKGLAEDKLSFAFEILEQLQETDAGSTNQSE